MPHPTITDEMIRAALESRAVDDEGPIDSLGALIGFPNRFLARSVVRAALKAAFRLLEPAADAALQQRINALEEALKPFSEAAKDLRRDDADTMRPATVQAIHFRRAADIMAARLELEIGR